MHFVFLTNFVRNNDAVFFGFFTNINSRVADNFLSGEFQNGFNNKYSLFGECFAYEVTRDGSVNFIADNNQRIGVAFQSFGSFNVLFARSHAQGDDNCTDKC